jgi:HSP20 family protein
MAEKRSDSTTATKEDQQREQGQQRQQGQASQTGQTQQENRLSRREQSRSTIPSPFALLQRLADGMAGVFDDLTSRPSSDATAAAGAFVPDVDVFQRGNELVVRADLPGVKPEDVSVEISDDAITISGERREEHEEERNGIYRYERSVGAFFRVIPLPEGAMTDQAKASFNGGVLEIAVPAPPEQVSRGRKLEIAQGEKNEKKSA